MLRRVQEKKGYRYLAVILIMVLLSTAYWYYKNNIFTTAIVKDGYIVATKIGNNEPKYFQVDVKLTNQNMINYDGIEER